MTNKELAEWFGIKEKSFRDTRAKKLEILKEYAEFENLRGKVNILKIKKPIYTKGSENYKLIKEKTVEQWNTTGLDTCSLVAEKIKKNYNDKLFISDTTLYSYTCNSKRELWGKAYGSGEIGHCIYELCKEINNECIPFTEEEKNIKSKLLKKYFGNADEKLFFITDMVKKGEIEQEEVGKTLEDMMNLDNNYMAFKTELEMIIGHTVVRATRVTTSAF